MQNISELLNKIVNKYFTADERVPITGYYFTLDFLKTLATLFVIIYHSGILRNNIISDNSGLTQYIYYFLSTLVGTCVPIFFFTSGYLLLNKDVHLNKVWGKMIKIIILILFLRMITFLVLHIFTGTPIGFKSIIIDTFSFHSGYTNHLWYLAALLSLYSVLLVIKLLFDENIKLFLFLLLSICIFVFGSKLLSQTFNITDILITTKNLQVIPFNNFIGDFNFYSSSRGFGIVYFMIGGLIYRYPSMLKKTTQLNYFGLIVLFISLQFIYNVLYSLNFNTLYDAVWWTYDNVFTIPLVITLYLIIDNFVVSNKIFRKFISLIGSNSLGIYLVHNIVIQLTSKYKYFIVGFHPNLGILYAFSVLIISLVITLTVLRIPYLKNFIQLNNAVLANDKQIS